MRIPTSTYRLRFNRTFTFNDARAIVPYLHELGISDHNKLNAAIGSRAEYDAWIAELHARGMGQILDSVPNQMGIECGT